MGTKHDPPPSKTVEAILAELGLDPSDWRIEIRFKGALSGGRGVVVEVTQLSTGRRAKASRRATTKNDARSKVAPLVREVLRSLTA